MPIHKKKWFKTIQILENPFKKRKKELFDNVIPSSNSMMAENLYKLGLMFDNEDFKKKSLQMVLMVNKLIKQETEYLANWAKVSLQISRPTAEILCVGDSFISQMNTLYGNYFSNAILMANTGNSELSLFEYKTPVNQQTTFFVCYNKACERPVHEIHEVVEKVHEVKWQVHPVSIHFRPIWVLLFAEYP